MLALNSRQLQLYIVRSSLPLIFLRYRLTLSATALDDMFGWNRITVCSIPPWWDNTARLHKPWRRICPTRLENIREITTVCKGQLDQVAEEDVCVARLCFRWRDCRITFLPPGSLLFPQGWCVTQFAYVVPCREKREISGVWEIRHGGGSVQWGQSMWPLLVVSANLRHIQANIGAEAAERSQAGQAIDWCLAWRGPRVQAFLHPGTTMAMCVLVWRTALAEGVHRSGHVADEDTACVDEDTACVDKDTACVDWDTQPVWMRTQSLCRLEHRTCMDEDTACVDWNTEPAWMRTQPV